METLPLSKWFPACEVPRGEVWSTKDMKTQCVVLAADGMKARYGEAVDVQLPTAEEIEIYEDVMHKIAHRLEGKNN
jgi:hypothetical protein